MAETSIPSDIDVRGKVIAVTGAAQGLGRAFALGLAARGARVALMDIDVDGCRSVAAETAALPGAPVAFVVGTDVADERSVEASMTELGRVVGRLDALISNAAYIPVRTPILETEVKVLERTWRTNVVGSFLVTKYGAPLMSGADGGRIIYLSSAIGVKPNPGLAAYGSTKAAIDVINNVAHQELADRNIRTVALAPGITETPGMRASVDTGYVESVAGRNPGGRLGQPDDLLSLVAFLCSDSSRYLSGTVIYVRPPGT